MVIRLLFALLAFFIPFMVYYGYRKIAGKNNEKVPKGTFAILSSCGMAIIVISILFFYSFSEDNSSREGTFVPAYVTKDGKIVPSHFE